MSREEVLNKISGMTAEDMKHIIARSMAMLHGKMGKSNVNISIDDNSGNLLSINSKMKF